MRSEPKIMLGKITMETNILFYIFTHVKSTKTVWLLTSTEWPFYKNKLLFIRSIFTLSYLWAVWSSLISGHTSTLYHWIKSYIQLIPHNHLTLLYVGIAFRIRGTRCYCYTHVLLREGGGRGCLVMISDVYPLFRYIWYKI